MAPTLKPLTLEALRLQPLIFKSAVERIDLLNRRGQTLSDKIAEAVQAWSQGYLYHINNAFYRYFINTWDLPTARLYRIDRSLIDTGDSMLDTLEDDLGDDYQEATEDGYREGFIFGLWDIYRTGASDELPDVPDEEGVSAAVAAGALGGVLIADRLSRWIGDAKLKLRTAVKMSMVRNMTLDESGDMFDTLAAQTFSRLDLLGEGELQRTFHQGQEAALKATFGADYAKVLLGEMWLTRGDTKVCPFCFALNKTITKLVPVEDSHPGCVLGDTTVGHASVVRTFDRLFKGPIVTVKTAGGKHLSLTENHPVLTLSGWKAAGLLNPGDDLICCDGSERVVRLADDHDDDMPASIAEVHEAFGSTGRVTTATEVETSAEDFHGDGAGSDVAEVRTDSRLLGDPQATVRQHLCEHGFLVGDEPQIALAGLGEFDSLPERHLPDPGSRVGTGDLCLPLLGGHALPPLGFNLGLRPQLDPLAEQESGDGQSGNPGPLRELKDRYPGQVVVDHVESVKVEMSECHVYNLETLHGYYTGNGIVVQNCRCIKVPIFDPKQFGSALDVNPISLEDFRSQL